MNIEIEQLADQQVIFMRRVGAYGPENFKLMNALKQWADKKGLLRNSVIYGVAQDNLDTPPEKCRYDVRLAAPEDCAQDGLYKKESCPAVSMRFLPLRILQKRSKRFGLRLVNA